MNHSFCLGDRSRGSGHGSIFLLYNTLPRCRQDDDLFSNCDKLLFKQRIRQLEVDIILKKSVL